MGKRKRKQPHIEDDKDDKDDKRMSDALKMLLELSKPKEEPKEEPQTLPDRTEMHQELIEHHRQRDIKRRNALIASRQSSSSPPPHATASPKAHAQPEESGQVDSTCSIQ